MLTFDADDTLYDHGMDLEVSLSLFLSLFLYVCVFVTLTHAGCLAVFFLQVGSWIVEALATLMEAGYYIAVVTAAGYPGKPERYAGFFIFLYFFLVSDVKCVECGTCVCVCVGGCVGGLGGSFCVYVCK